MSWEYRQRSFESHKQRERSAQRYPRRSASGSVPQGRQLRAKILSGIVHQRDAVFLTFRGKGEPVNFGKLRSSSRGKLLGLKHEQGRIELDASGKLSRILIDQ